MESWTCFSVSAQTRLKVLLLLWTCKGKQASKSNRINPATLARPPWNSCETFFYKLTRLWGRKCNRSRCIMCAARTSFLLEVLSRCIKCSLQGKVNSVWSSPGLDKPGLAEGWARPRTAEGSDGQWPGAASAGTPTAAHTNDPVPTYIHPGRKRGTSNTCKQ